MVAMMCSGLMICTVSSVMMLAAVTTPFSWRSMRMVLGCSLRFLTTRLLMLRMMSVTSSTTPGIDVGAGRQAGDPAFRGLAGNDFEKIRDRLRVALLVELDERDAAGPALDRHLVPGLEQDAGDVAVLVVDHDVAMGHELAG